MKMPSGGGSFIVSQFSMSANLPRQKPVNDLLHPGSFRVQAHFLSCLFQSGTARETDLQSVRWKLRKKKMHQIRSGTGSSSYMISIRSQWELGRISSTLPMWRPIRRLSVSMQRQCCSTPRLLRLIPVRRRRNMVTKMHFSFKGSSNASSLAWSDIWN